MRHQVQVCPENACLGSVMMPNHLVRKPDDLRTKEERLTLAIDFIDQYYSSIKRWANPAVSKDKERDEIQRRPECSE